MDAAKSAKVYVNVIAEFASDGQMLPRRLTWEDGEKYKIDRIINICQATAMKSGGQGDRYTVMIGGQQSYLFFERSGSIGGNNIGRWFVERKKT
jgi:hypothetical protein